MKITELDKNFEAKKVGNIKLKIYDASKSPIKFYGVIFDNELGFHRMDTKISSTVSESVNYLQRHTAGGRIAFSTDSKNIYVKAEYFSKEGMPHMALTGSSGFTLVKVEENKPYKHIGTLQPLNDTLVDEALFKTSKRRKMFTYILWMPLYNNVKNVYIGIEPKASICEPELYKENKDPVVFYGSSITQGGCASKPDNSYQSYISEKYDIDILNLGMSGNAKGEENMAKYISEIKMSLFVYDYDHNAPNSKELKETHEKFFKLFRKKQPNTPVIMISKPNFYDSRENLKENKIRKNIIYQTYTNAVNNGDKNVFFIDGSKIYPSKLREHCAVDTAHPTDLGFYYMALAIIKVIDKNHLL